MHVQRDSAHTEYRYFGVPNSGHGRNVEGPYPAVVVPSCLSGFMLSRIILQKNRVAVACVSSTGSSSASSLAVTRTVSVVIVLLGPIRWNGTSLIKLLYVNWDALGKQLHVLMW